jgi:hypothetical protein
MPMPRNALRIFFARELAGLARGWSALGGLARALRPRPRRRAPAVVAPEAVLRAPAFQGPLARGPRLVVPGSFCLSVLAHAAILAALFTSWERGGSPEPMAAREAVVTFSIRVEPPAPPPSGPPPAVAEPPPPEEPAAPADVDRNEPPPPRQDGSIAGTEPDPAPGDPTALVDRPDLPGQEPLPLPGIGPGGAPPPLPPGSGSRRGFWGRAEGKGQALGKYGGSGRTEGAVTRGLKWLAEHQDEDGGWSADGFQRHCRHVTPCGGRGFPEFDTGVAALAVLAFLGAGHAPAPAAFDVRSPVVAAGSEDRSPYRRNVEKALDYLLGRQDGRGAFGAVGENYLYNHALATLAVSEALAMTGARRFRESLEAAVAFSASAQQSGGGWDYTARSTGRNDLSITGWQVMALHAAAAAGVEVPGRVLDRCRAYLAGAMTADGQGIYTNLGQEAGRRGINMVAVGLLSRLYMGASRNDRVVRAAAGRILRAHPDWESTASWDQTFQSYYYWYTATLALFHLGGEEWKAWNFFVARAVLALQSARPHEEGSWPPEPSWIGASGGRVYATALNVLTLETYYRYEPLFKPRKL